MDISKKISMIDNAFSDYIMKKSNDSDLEKSIGVCLSAFSGKNITVALCDCEDNKEPFFAFRIFPVASKLDDFVKDMISEETVSFSNIYNTWREITDWYLEIDSRVFNRYELNFNPKQLSALVLHEYGHTVYSDTVVERFYRAYNECKIRESDACRSASKVLYFLYEIPLVFSCYIHNWKVGPTGLKEEIFADQSVEKLGYGDDLLSAMNKIIKAYGNSGNPSQEEMDAHIKREILWCELNAVDIIRRKGKLRDELFHKTKRSKSRFLRKLGDYILESMGAKTRERYTGSVVESTVHVDIDNFADYKIEFDLEKSGFLERRVQFAIESAQKHTKELAMEAFGRKKKDNEIPTQLDIDSIYVEVDRITNHMDRQYCLDLIYNQIDRIETFKQMFEYNVDLKHKYSGKMESMLKELASLRQSVLNKRNFDKEYKLFVKYPAGYEG